MFNQPKSIFDWGTLFKMLQFESLSAKMESQVHHNSHHYLMFYNHLISIFSHLLYQ